MEYILDFHGKILTVDNDRFLFRNIESISRESIVCFDRKNNNFFCGNEAIFFSDINKEIFVSKENKNIPQIDYYREFICISFLGVFVSSEPNGSIKFTHLNEKWEKFLPITTHTLDLMKFIKQKTENKGKKFEIRNFCFSFNENLFFIDKNKDVSLNDDRIILVDKNLSLFEIEKFNPVIYFCAFSSHEIINCALLSIESYKKYSNVDFSFIIFTNIKDFVFPTLSDAVKIIYIESIGIISHLYKRYSKDVMMYLRSYSPIIYSDCDIICNNDIKDVVEKSYHSDLIYTNVETKATKKTIYESGWFIGNFYKNDIGIQNKEIKAVNSGFFCFKKIKNFEFIYENIEKIYMNIYEKNGRNHFCYDQSAFNYILTKFMDFDADFLGDYVNNWPNENHSSIPVCGIVHFCGSVGRFSSKSDKMNSYLNYLITIKP